MLDKVIVGTYVGKSNCQAPIK